MNGFLSYIIELNIVFSILMLFFHVFFKGMSFYRVNRIILLSFIPVSTLIPFLMLPNLSEYTGITYTLSPIHVIDEIEEANNLFPLSLQFIYWSVLFVLVMLFLVNLSKIVLFIRKQGEEKSGQFYLVHPNGAVPSFSFFNRIHLSEKGTQESETCLKHELVHVKSLHSLDNLFFTLFCCISWFNPLAWYARYLVKMNHEFQADQQTSQVISKDNYIDILLQQSAMTPVNTLVHGYNNYSSLKSRIIMLTRKPTHFHHKWKYLLLIPATALGIVLHSCKSEDEKNTVVSQQVESDEVLFVADKMPEFPGGQEALYQFMAENIKYPEEAKASGIEGMVHVSFVVQHSGELSNIEVVKSEHASLDPAALKTIQQMPNWQPGEHEGKMVNVKCVLPIKFALK